jgi:hypothetical protein
MWAYLRSRPWNSRSAGSSLAFTLTDNTTNGDKQVSMSGLDVTIDNHSNVYWIDVSPQNGGDPGELCVYGIHITYDCSGCVLFEDGFERGSTAAWSSSVP